MFQRLLAVTLVALAASACSEATPDSLPLSAQTPEGARAIPDRWLVEFESAPGARPDLHQLHQVERSRFWKAIANTELQIEGRHDYSRLWNGLSVKMSRRDVSKLTRLGLVKAVFPVLEVTAPAVRQESGSRPDLGTAVTMTGADIAQNTLGLTGTGIRVGIIDTGVDYTHPDLGGCFGPGCRVAFGTDFVGDAYDQSTAGAAIPVPDADPMDCAGHGTHVAGIVGANGVLKGVAPGVTFGAYRVFGCNGSTDSSIMIQAMEAAANDGMRIINMSIGSPFQWPDYPSARAATALLDEGVIVVTSNGNSGDRGLFASGAPGSGRDVIAVGSVDNIGIAKKTLTVSPDNAKIGYNAASNAPAPPTSGSFPLARTGTTTTDGDGCVNAPAAGSLTGKVVLIRRGSALGGPSCGFYNKAIAAQNAGAAGVIIYNNAAGELAPTVAGTPPITIPVAAISKDDGALIDGRIAAGATTMSWTAFTTYSPSTTGGQPSTFSSWGPTAELDIKPDVSAPGGSIYSTYPVALGSYASLSGSSMASPHVVGAAALLLEARPSLNPVTIRPALANSAVPYVYPTGTAAGTAASVLQLGAGVVHIDVSAQAHAAVTPWKLSLGESQQGAWTRTLTFTNDGATPLTLTATHLAAVTATGETAATIPVSGIYPRTVNLSATAPSTVGFGAPTVTVPAQGSATLDVSITPDPTLVDGAFLSGYLVFSDGTTTLRVPYGGHKGDYQQRQILAPTTRSYPWLVSKATPATRLVTGGTFTLQGTDQPQLVVHYESFARKLVVEVSDAVTGKPWGIAREDQFIGRDSNALGISYLPWDGSVTFNKSSLLVPNGQYFLKLRVLKALGDESNPADWESWTSPTITINHP